MMNRCPKRVLHLFTEHLSLWRTSTAGWCLGGEGPRRLAPQLAPPPRPTTRMFPCLRGSGEVSPQSRKVWYLHSEAHSHPCREPLPHRALLEGQQHHPAAQPLLPVLYQAPHFPAPNQHLLNWQQTLILTDFFRQFCTYLQRACAHWVNVWTPGLTNAATWWESL